jgi:hypothetical protein
MNNVHWQEPSLFAVSTTSGPAHKQVTAAIAERFSRLWRFPAGTADGPMQESRSRDYPIQENMEFQRASWVVERAGWAVLTLLLIAALAGLFGHGWLSKQTIADGNLRVEFERFQRVTKVTPYIISLKGGGEPKLTLGRAFQTSYEVIDMEPQPIRSSASANGIELQFAPMGDNLRAVIWARPRSFGRMHFSLASGGETLTVRAFIYP